MNHTWRKRDLVFWLGPRMRIPPYTRNKHWCFVHSVNRSKKNPKVYVVCNSAAHWVAPDQLVFATIEQIIRYQRDHYGKSAMVTRNEIAQAEERLSW